MPTTHAGAAKVSKGDEFPDDAVPLKRAAFLAKMSRASIMRRAEAGTIREWKRPDGSGRFYSAAECAALAPRRVR